MYQNILDQPQICLIKVRILDGGKWLDIKTFSPRYQSFPISLYVFPKFRIPGEYPSFIIIMHLECGALGFGWSKILLVSPPSKSLNSTYVLS